jgi:hypothetical protein
MTWGEFKAKIQEFGVLDDDEIEFIDVPSSYYDIVVKRADLDNVRYIEIFSK